ncbi:hypothetical protein RJ639_040693 [Escallonia herrerae]|uniref:RNase H type-1 domain-containing protein n=1 Tax=Escallonia herrerae TaxID=1293975 RepID=A0AA88WF59_9ASTE|nr:hypothetical protein RJ639_040693 [Escallonia herrerae]
MSGLNTKVIVHHLDVKSGVRPVKQAQCAFHPKTFNCESGSSQLWMMFFDGAAQSDGVGAGVIFVSPQQQGLIIGLQMALEPRIPSLAVSGDSKLLINQLPKEYEVKKEDPVSYFRNDTNLINKFYSVELEHISREENRMVNA